MLNQPPQTNSEQHYTEPSSGQADNDYSNSCYGPQTQPFPMYGRDTEQQFGVLPPPEAGPFSGAPFEQFQEQAVPDEATGHKAFMSLEQHEIAAADEWIESRTRQQGDERSRRRSPVGRRTSPDRRTRMDDHRRRGRRSSRSGEDDRNVDDYRGEVRRRNHHRADEDERSMRNPSKYDKPRKAQKKAYKYWDVPPRGFEHITPMQYKQMQGAGQIPQLLVDRDLAINTAAATPVLGSHVVHQSRRL